MAETAGMPPPEDDATRPPPTEAEKEKGALLDAGIKRSLPDPYLFVRNKMDIDDVRPEDEMRPRRGELHHGEDRRAAPPTKKRPAPPPPPPPEQVSD